MGELVFVYGAMGSGKSLGLLKSAYQLEQHGLPFVIAKPSLDARGGDQITARGSMQPRTVDVLLEPHMNAREAIVEHMARHAIHAERTVVMVDEVQFVTAPQANQLKELAEYDVAEVIAYGLRTDFKLDVFPAAERMFAHANRFENIPIPCRCGVRKAENNTRLIGGKFVFEGDQIAVDGMGEITYSSLCFQCYDDEKAAAQNPADALLL